MLSLSELYPMLLLPVVLPVVLPLLLLLLLLLLSGLALLSSAIEFDSVVARIIDAPESETGRQGSRGVEPPNPMSCRGLHCAMKTGVFPATREGFPIDDE
jgi:hypothetical protein